MSQDQFESLSTDIAMLRHVVIALAFASPHLEDVVAEIARQQEFAEVALIPAPVNDKYIELVRAKLQGLHDLLAAQV